MKYKISNMYYGVSDGEASLSHHGILGQKWGVRRYQNKDGSLTAAGKKRYGTSKDNKSGKRSTDELKRINSTWYDDEFTGDRPQDKEMVKFQQSIWDLIGEPGEPANTPKLRELNKKESSAYEEYIKARRKHGMWVTSNSASYKKWRSTLDEIADEVLNELGFEVTEENRNLVFPIMYDSIYQ